MQQKQIHRSFIFGLFNTTTCFDLPDQPSSGKAWIQIDNKTLEVSSCKLTN